MQKTNSLFRFLSLIIFSFSTIQLSAQTGLNFQGVARTSNNIIIASQPITLKLSILQGSATGNTDYVETRRVVTNAQGLFNVVIGDTGAISAIGDFPSISWKNTPKFLKIEMDPTAGSNFITMGTTQFQYVAYAEFAKSVEAESIVGIVPVSLGGTGVNSLTNLKTALAIDKINNTADLSKPISTLTQTALDLKLNAVDTSKFIKLAYLDSALLTKLNSTAVVATATNALTATNATTAISATSATTATYAVSAGTASTATKLATARNINGVAFDGSGDITITATADAGTLTGTALKSTITSSSLTSVGTLSAGSIPYSLLTGTVPTWNQNTTGNAATATTAITATTASSAISATTATTAITAISATTAVSAGTASTATSALSASTATVAGNITATTNTTITSLANLNTVGTIVSGTWSGTVISLEKGGTGLTTPGANGQVLTSTAAGTLTWTTPATAGGGGGSAVHTIGEAYGGGIVFYVYDGGAHGLITSTANLLLPNGSFLVRWYGGSFTNTRARANGIGGGLKNTAIAIANQAATDGIDFAATLCNQYTVTETVNGVQTTFGDWYLPSLYELKLLYAQKTIVGGFFHPGYYWSSTEFDNISAWLVNFIDGGNDFDYKSNANVVRAIRAF